MSAEDFIEELITSNEKCLTDEEKLLLEEQNKRLVPEFKAQQLESQAQRHWDIFYKRNETRFFKDRRWTTREFEELLVDTGQESTSSTTNESIKRYIFEIGCGVGNLIFPLVEDDNTAAYTFFYACDFSPRAVDFVRSHALYNLEKMLAFQCDITTQEVHKHIAAESLNICTLIFVLSAIHPRKFVDVVRNIWQLLKPGGMVLFRDYGLYDMAQLRFKGEHKISNNFYARQDGTRSYYFAVDELGAIFTEQGFEVLSNAYVHRRTLNVKEKIDVQRIFLQAKFRKPFTNIIAN